jgi:hypothetical protein
MLEIDSRPCVASFDSCRSASGGSRDAQHDGGDQGGQDAARPPCVEVREGERAAPDVAQDAAGDQVSGNDEENVDAGKPGLEAAELEVKQNDDADRNRPQAVDIRSIRTFQRPPPRAFRGAP